VSRHDSTHWLDEEQLTQLFIRVGVPYDGRSEIRCSYMGGERRWNFWDVQDWLDEKARDKYRGLDNGSGDWLGGPIG
jgi:hypothetical protein